MNIKNIRINCDALANGGPAIVQSVAPDYEYDADRKRTDKVIGLRVTVVFPSNNYDTQIVKVADPTDRISALLAKATPTTPVYAEFDGFRASIYTMMGTDARFRVGVSARADAVRVVSGATADALDLDID